MLKDWQTYGLAFGYSTIERQIIRRLLYHHHRYQLYIAFFPSQNSKRKSVRAVLYVHGDGLRVVDDETKGLIVDQGWAHQSSFADLNSELSRISSNFEQNLET